MSNRYGGRKWHQQKRWILGSLLLFPPLGIPLLWFTRWPRSGKVGGSIFSGIILLLSLAGEASEPTAVSVEQLPALAVTKELREAAPAKNAAYEDAIAGAMMASEALPAAESSADWEKIVQQWQRALSLLGDIPISSDDYNQAQVKIAEYERNYDYAIAQRDAVDVLAAELLLQQQVKAEEITRQAAQALAQAQAAEQEVQRTFGVVESQDSYVSGTCKELKASGVGSDFRPGDANYTSARDRDDDGVACES